jgi:predicted O-methyltransferase YrrM
MNIKLNNTELDNFTMKNFEYLVTPTYYNLKSGKQEYKLYSYLTTFFNETVILDIGTSHGTSAVALSHNINNKVISYDIVDCIRNPNHIIYKKENIEFKIKNVLQDLNSDFLKNIKIIMIDIDHYGEMEQKIIEKLIELNFSGIVILDDVFNHPDHYINYCMKKIWDNIKTPKFNVTKYGHWSGTGIILMNTDINIILD